MTKPLDQLVKPEKKYEWDNEIRDKWLVTDSNCIDQVREPGLFKVEAEVTCGSFIALRNV